MLNNLLEIYLKLLQKEQLKNILETASKRAIKKTTEAATGDLNCSRKANKITKNSAQSNSNRRKIKDNKTTNYWRSKIIILIK